MVSINYSAREVCCKIVYYGPGLSGKTTNLQYVHAKVPGNTRGNLISLATEADRTLYFDFLPINIGTINGFAAKFQLYTVPGQVYYNATRKLVLRGVDGLVFVADSQPDKMDENIESLVNLEDNLREYGYNMDDLPVVIQYNKRDLPGVLPVTEMESKLNSRGWPSFEASATVGNGVFDTLKLIIKLVLEKAKNAGSGRSTAATSAGASAGREAVGSPPQQAPAPQAETTSPRAQETPVSQNRPEQPSPAPQAPPPQPEPVTAPAGASPQHEAGAAPATVAAQQRSPQESAEVTQSPRPFPGDQTGEVSLERAKPSADAEPAGSASKEPTDSSPTSGDAPRQSPETPPMAPPLRQRRRKRGFFKRLFGIK